MKVKHLFFSILAMAGMLTGCLSEPDFAPVIEDGIPINLDGSVRQVPTKVNAQGFETGDALGLYAVNYEDGNLTPGTLLAEGNQADHVKYIFDYDKWQWTPVRKVYYKDINTNVDLYVFYPYAEPSSVEAYNFEVQKDQSSAETVGKLAGYEASDFLWAKVENVAPTEGKIKVKLDHKMAGAQVILAEGDGFEEGEFPLLEKTVMAVGVTRKASIDMSTGEVAPVGEAQATGIVMCPQTDGSFRSIIVPQTVTAGTYLFSLTVDGKVSRFKKDIDFTYEPGKISRFTIRINRKVHTGEYELEPVETEIVPWMEDLNQHDGEARQYYCVNVTEPGTLGRLIKADGKNPMKIRNLKVSGTISDEDFYFMRDSMAILEAVNLKETRVVDVEVTNHNNVKVSNTHYLCDGFLSGHNDEYGNPTRYVEREEGTYDDIIPDVAFAGKKSLYYFTFPEKINQIGYHAFNGSSISGALVIPDDVTHIWSSAFSGTNISSLVLAPKVEILGGSAFYNCSSLSGTLTLPETLKYIGSFAFQDCSFTGNLILPNSLEYIGEVAFHESGTYVGDLTIPEKLPILYGRTFSCNYKRSFTGTLNLSNVQEIGERCFHNCGFSGEVIVPDGITNIPAELFQYNGGGKISSLVLPSSIKTIGTRAFKDQQRLSRINFPEGLLVIGQDAFEACSHLQSLELPSTLQTIQLYAFKNCFGITSIICHSTEPPTVMAGAFDGVPKDNFTLQVPANAVNRYATDPVWGQFRRISAYQDFSISRNRARALNAETSKTYILRAPANHNWSVESKPDWITVTPSSGTGKAEVTVTFSEMAAADAASISVQTTDPAYAYQTTTKTLNGRAGEIVFLLEDKDYRTTMAVEQLDYKYGDGDVITLNEATKGDGVDIVFLGDCYDAADIAAGNYLADIEEAVGHYFALEPYKTYKDYFNVYTVLGVSDDSGMGTLNTIKDAKFGSTFGEKNLVQPDMDMCFEYACKAPIDDNLAQTLIVLVENTTEYGGVCYMYGDGTAVACCPKSADAYPYDFRGIVQHEAGGHGFGKLADEYIYHNAFISTCTCTDGCGHVDDFLANKNRGWYANLELTGDMNEVGWSHFIFHPKYSNVVDIYEGGYFHTRGVYRSEPTSCMNNNIPYYSAISRQAMVERIMEYSGETFDLEEFIAKDVTTAGPTTKAGIDLMPVETFYDNGKQHAPVYMGEKPDFRK